MYVCIVGSYIICPSCKGTRVDIKLVDHNTVKCPKCNGFGVLISLVKLS